MVKKLTILESKSFHSLNVSNQWYGMAKGKFPCDTCGGEHYAPNFLHPRDKAKIKKAKQ